MHVVGLGTWKKGPMMRPGRVIYLFIQEMERPK